MPSVGQPIYLAFMLGALTILLNMAIGYELLHTFFWMNVGVLLFYVDRLRKGEGPEDPFRTLAEPAPSTTAVP
jgi:hypothetical protein